MTQGFDKSVYRNKYKEIRNCIKSRVQKEKQIFERLTQCELIEKTNEIFAYAAHGSEVNIDDVIRFAFNKGKKVALPVCTDKNGTMEFYFIKSFNDVKDGMYGIREPDISECEKAYFTSESVCLVPGLCFDINGSRLGYGKGYYDRFMEIFNGYTIGVGFDECVSDKIPSADHDKKVTYLITDKNIYNFGK